MPSNLGCFSVVLAATTTLAPSAAALRAISFPIPRLAPVIKIVLPKSFLWRNDISKRQTFLEINKPCVGDHGWFSTLQKFDCFDSGARVPRNVVAKKTDDSGEDEEHETL